MGPRESLNQYINSARNKPFAWGKNDCLTFTNDAFRAIYGKGWADDWLDRYMENEMPIGRKQLEQEFGFKIRELSAKISQRLNKINYVPDVVNKKNDFYLNENEYCKLYSFF